MRFALLLAFMLAGCVSQPSQQPTPTPTPALAGPECDTGKSFNESSGPYTLEFRVLGIENFRGVHACHSVVIYTSQNPRVPNYTVHTYQALEGRCTIVEYQGQEPLETCTGINSSG